MELVMDKEEMKRRTKQFALRAVQLVEALPRGRTADVLGRQLLRSGTSVGANYRAACRAKSTADFIAKMGIVEEEADESMYWMELLVEAGIVKAERLESLMKEGNEILAITVASINTARKHK
jgi:four helix bundle protein